MPALPSPLAGAVGGEAVTPEIERLTQERNAAIAMIKELQEYSQRLTSIFEAAREAHPHGYAYVQWEEAGDTYKFGKVIITGGP